MFGCYKVQDGPKDVKFETAAHDDTEKCSVYQNVQIFVWSKSEVSNVTHLTPEREPNILMCGMTFCIIISPSYKLLEILQVFGPPCSALAIATRSFLGDCYGATS